MDINNNYIEGRHEIKYQSGWSFMPTSTIFLPGLFFNVYIESPNPKNPESPKSQAANPIQLETPTPKTQS